MQIVNEKYDGSPLCIGFRRRVRLVWFGELQFLTFAWAKTAGLIASKKDISRWVLLIFN
jgi:hypothetical protein